MVARNVHDSISDKSGTRLKAWKDKKDGSTVHEYSSGAWIKTEVTEKGDGRYLKEVRTVTQTHAPTPYFTTPYGPGDYERIFGKKGAEEGHDG